MFAIGRFHNESDPRQAADKDTRHESNRVGKMLTVQQQQEKQADDAKYGRQKERQPGGGGDNLVGSGCGGG